MSVGWSISGRYRKPLNAKAPWLQARQRLVPDALILDIAKFERATAGTPTFVSGSIFARSSGRERFVSALAPHFELASRPAAGRAIGLRLPPSMALHGKLVVPALAEGHLRTAISYEIDRLTPFTAQEVLWSFREEARTRNKLHLSLFIVSKAAIAPLLALLADEGLPPSFIERGDSRIDLGRRKYPSLNTRTIVLAGISCLLALALMAIPLIGQQRALDATHKQFRMLMPEQQEIASLRQHITELETKDKLTAAAQFDRNELQIIARLTNALPNGTWLSHISVAGDVVSITGQSTDAAHLISVLETSPGFRNPCFVGPITRTSDNTADLFALQMQLAD